MSQKIKTSVEIDGSLSASQIANATIDTDKFLVSDGGTIKYRTGAELVQDLGIQPGETSKVQHQVKAGVAINKGQAVYVTGADGTNMIVGLASNTSEATSSKTMGLLNATVAANGFADVITEGLLDGLNTIGANAGDPVWLGANGNLIYGLANKPYAPLHLVFIGIVTRVNANNGEIFIKVQNGFELNEVHDVDLKTTIPVNGHVLGFDGTLWVNKTIAGWLGYTPVPETRTITINGNTQNLAANRTFNIDTGVTSFNTRTGAVTLSSADVTNALGYTPVTQARTITINGVTQDLSANRSFTVTTPETDTLATVTGRGNTTSTQIGAPNFFDSNVGSYNVNLGSGGSEGRGLVAGYSGGSYGGIGYNVRHTTTGGSWVAPLNDTSTYLLFTAGGFNFQGAGSGTAGRTLSYTTLATLGLNGVFAVPGDVRSTIFYDSNNTGYYADPASTSVFNNLTLTGPTGDSPYLTLANGPYFSTISSGEIILRNLSSLRFSDVSTYDYNAWAGLKFVNSTKTIHIGVAGSQFTNNTPQTGFVNMPNCNLTVERDIRTPIYYDSNNTGFYLDPASTSNINAINISGNSSIFGGYGPGSGPGLGFENQGSFIRLAFWDMDFYDWNLGSVLRLNSFAQSDTSFRAPIFYDSADTTYFLNLNGGSYVRGMFEVAGGHYDTEIRLTARGGELGTGQTSAMSWWISEPGVTWNDGGFGYNVTNDGGSPNGFGRLNTNYGQAYMRMTTNGNWLFYTTNTSGTRFTNIELTPNGNSRFNGQVTIATGGASGLEILSPTGTQGLWVRTGWNANGTPTPVSAPTNVQFQSSGNSGGTFTFCTGNDVQLTINGGGIISAGDVTAFSDKRVKENICTIENALDKVCRLRGVTYNRIDSEDKKQKIGVIAQEVQEVIPQVVQEQENGMLGVSYGNINALLIEAIKEQQVQIEELKQLVKQLTQK